MEQHVSAMVAMWVQCAFTLSASHRDAVSGTRDLKLALITISVFLSFSCFLGQINLLYLLLFLGSGFLAAI